MRPVSNPQTHPIGAQSEGAHRAHLLGKKAISASPAPCTPAMPVDEATSLTCIATTGREVGEGSNAHSCPAAEAKRTCMQHTDTKSHISADASPSLASHHRTPRCAARPNILIQTHASQAGRAPGSYTDLLRHAHFGKRDKPDDRTQLGVHRDIRDEITLPGRLWWVISPLRKVFAVYICNGVVLLFTVWCFY